MKLRGIIDNHRLHDVLFDFNDHLVKIGQEHNQGCQTGWNQSTHDPLDQSVDTLFQHLPPWLSRTEPWKHQV